MGEVRVTRARCVWVYDENFIRIQVSCRACDGEGDIQFENTRGRTSPIRKKNKKPVKNDFCFRESRRALENRRAAPDDFSLRHQIGNHSSFEAPRAEKASSLILELIFF